MKSVLVRLPAAFGIVDLPARVPGDPPLVEPTPFDDLEPVWQNAIVSLNPVWGAHGRARGGNKIIDALLADDFIVAGETDALGNPLTPTDLPPGWTLMMAWRYDAVTDSWVKLMEPHPQLIDHQPDDVTYNPDGTEASRTPAAALREVHKFLGWPDRSF